MTYSYFGNTSLRVKEYLYNIEIQLILFEQLFKESQKSEKWEPNSTLQLKYVKLLIDNDLLSTNETKLISKNARVKSAPIEQLGLINRKQKIITPKGIQLLKLIKNKAFKKKNNFLQIDLISLFFLQNLFFYSKNSKKENLFETYLEVFKQMDGYLHIEEFKLISLVKNLNFDLFINELKNIRNLKTTPFNLISLIIEQDNDIKIKRDKFINDYTSNKLEGKYFYSSRGISGQTPVLKLLKAFEIILLQQKYTDYEKDIIRTLFKTNELKIYIKHITPTHHININKNSFLQNYKALFKYIRKNLKNNFPEKFFNFIYACRVEENLNDYLDLNKRHLILSDVFEFSSTKVTLSKIFYILLEHPKNIYTILKNIEINENSLDYLINDKYVLKKLKSYKVSSVEELKKFKYNNDKKILEQTIKEKFSKNKIIKEILPLFINRTKSNDNKLQSLVTNFAKIPTIFEYIISICWYYLNDKNPDIILNAGLSLDSQMLPKTHAIGGNADIYIKYNDHVLMLEVTLTEKTNQRRAEMEPVSRHLGNLLIDIDNSKRENSYAIFIAPHLDANVINDFRAKKYTYWERGDKYIEGMNILPINIENLISLIKSNKTYPQLKPIFLSLLKSDTTWGSKWYKYEIEPTIKSL